LVAEILTYLQMGAVCMANPNEGSRTIIIVGAGDNAGLVSKITAALDESMPIIIINDAIPADIGCIVGAGKDIGIVGKTIGVVDNVPVANQIPIVVVEDTSLVDCSETLLSETAFEIQKLIDEAIVYHEDYLPTKENSKCEHCQTFPVYHAPCVVAQERGRYPAGLPP